MATQDYSKFSPFNDREGRWINSKGTNESLAVGQSTMDRSSAVASTMTVTTGDLRLAYFTATNTETVVNARTITGGTAAVGPTLCRVGLYSVAANGDLTLVASTANDTALWIATQTRYTKALQAGFEVQRGDRYAIGILCVGATTPTMLGNAIMSAAENGEEPRVTANLTAQADLPSSIASGSLANLASRIYAVVTP